jgi:hypothetical protein
MIAAWQICHIINAFTRLAEKVNAVKNPSIKEQSIGGSFRALQAGFRYYL